MFNRGRAIVYTVVVFCAGFAAGALFMNLGEHFWLHPTRASATASVPATRWNSSDRNSVIEQFKSELRLTDAQTKQLEIILDETVRQYHDLRAFSFHIRQEGITRIRAMLDETQRKRFDEIVKKAEHQTPQKKPARPPSK